MDLRRKQSGGKPARKTPRRRPDRYEDSRGHVVGIEVKAAATVSGADFSGLPKLAEFQRLQRQPLLLTLQTLLAHPV